MKKIFLSLILIFSSSLFAAAPISEQDPSSLLPSGNDNGLSPTEAYAEYGSDGNPMRYPVPFAQAQCINKACHYPTNRWFTDLLFYARANNDKNIADNFIVAQSPYYLRIYDDEHRTNEMLDLLPGLYTHLNLPYLNVNSLIQPTVNRINHDTYVSTLMVDPTYHFGLTVPSHLAKNTERSILDYDNLSLTTAWKTTNGGRMTAYLVRGAPYLTMAYQKLPFTLTSFQSAGIYAIASDEQAPIIPQNGQIIKGRNFRFVVLAVDASAGDRQASGTFPLRYYEYMIFADKEISLQFTPNLPGRIYYTLQSTENLNDDVVRIAYVNAETGADNNIDPAKALAILSDGRNLAIEKMLTDYANVYPIAAAVKLTSENSSGTVFYQWKTKTMDKSADNKDLLMMTFASTNLQDIKRPDVSYEIQTLRGKMLPVIGNQWTLKVSYSKELDQHNLWFGSLPLNQNDISLLQASLNEDMKYIGLDADPQNKYLLNPHVLNDSYGFGKEIARLARLALIADQIGDRGDRDKIIAVMKNAISPWFSRLKSTTDPFGTHQGYFKYDNKFGGIITARASINPSRCEKDQCGYNLDFYNGQYTDHHFHYGYFLYAAAVIAKYDAAWLADYKETVNLLARDLANPSSDDPYFTAYRYFDWFEGHAFANGLVPGGDGRNQESTSEAVNAWYGLTMWGEVTANTALANEARIMTSLEIKAAQQWTQIRPKNSAYDSYVAKGQSFFNSHAVDIAMNQFLVSGINWSLKIDHTTFFGVKQAYITGIQMMPYTPITSALLNPDWLKENEAALKESVNALADTINLFTDASDDSHNIFNQYGEEYAQIYRENPSQTKDIYWAGLQGTAEGSRMWAIITSLALAPVDPAWAYQMTAQNKDGKIYNLFLDINKAFDSSPRVTIGKNCEGQDDPNVLCYKDADDVGRLVGTPQFVRPGYESVINGGFSFTNNLWWVLVHRANILDSFSDA